MSASAPLVTVLICTYHHSETLCTAVRSALRQTLSQIQVLVVIDGPDEAPIEALQEVSDPRLEVLTMSEHGGLPVARNWGVDRAAAPWVAILDDDDEWMADKLDIQLATARASQERFPIIGCRFIARIGQSQRLWPRRAPRPDEPISEYLFCRHGLFFGEGVLPPTTLLLPTELMRLLPHNPQLLRFQDVDWLIRATGPGLGHVVLVEDPRPLAIWNRTPHHQKRTSPSPGGDWRTLLAWFRSSRPRLTPRAYGSGLLTWAATGASIYGQWEAFWPLLSESVRSGRPTVLDFIVYLAYWLAPRALGERLSGVLDRRPAPKRKALDG